MMKQFRFRLEQVLRWRATVREMKHRALADLDAQLVRERQVLADLLGLKAELLAELAKQQEGAFAAGERALYESYLEWLGLELDKERKTLEELEILRETKRMELVTAQQDVKAVERLKERQRVAYAGDMGRMEQGLLDEVANGAFVRALRAAGDGLPKGRG